MYRITNNPILKLKKIRIAPVFRNHVIKKQECFNRAEFAKKKVVRAKIRLTDND